MLLHKRRQLTQVLPLLFVLGLLSSSLLASCTTPSNASMPIRIGLIAPLTGPLAASGEAIQRGILLAIDEVNAAGGIEGRPLELVVRDVQNDSEGGRQALRELNDEGVVAVFGGIFSGVMVSQLDLIHELEIPLINPWGSMSAVTDNGYDPNFAFRVSVSDAYADEFLVRFALEVVGSLRPAIFADSSIWGETNLEGLQTWLQAFGVEPVSIQRFDQGESNLLQAVEAAWAAEADSILLVANASEGAALIRSLRAIGWAPPVVSHWGISGGQFQELVGSEIDSPVYTLQTFTFIDNDDPVVQRVAAAYHERFGTGSAEDILAPVGVAHGYDGLQLLARALGQSESITGAEIRRSLEQLPPFRGLVKEYAPAFSPERHDALLAPDYLMMIWREGRLVPAETPRLVAP